MRGIYIVCVLFVSLVASDARVNYEKVIYSVERYYFKSFTLDELVSNNINDFLQNTPYIIEHEKQKIKQKLKTIKSRDKKLEFILELFEKKGFSNNEVYEMLIKSCMNLLDEHSHYLDKKQMQELNIRTQGIFVGFGIIMSKIDNSLVVLDVLKNSPASKAGIKVSDIVLKIDDFAYDEISLNRAVELLHKDIGEFVSLLIKRDATLINAKLKVDTLEFKKLKNRILYFKISSFDASIAMKISNKLKEHQKSSRAIILDLRGNPGGFVSQAVKIADMFLNRGNIITQIGREGSDKKYFDASKEMTLSTLPLMVLVDSNTASSAEILSGALQIHHRATLFGERTFGKGSVETLYSINRDESISLTVAHYFLADFSTIEGVGILPDYEINTLIVEGRDECLESAKEFLDNKENFTKKYSSQISGVCTKEEK